MPSFPESCCPRPVLRWAMAAWVLVMPVAALAATCEARSGPLAPRVVELYTSEGCSSCPPADRWLSSLSGRSDVVALAFHVTYWDRLGWPDRFAQPAFTERQRARGVASGARQLYTPQVIVDGRDWTRWPNLPPAATAPLDLWLRSDGATVTVSVERRPEARGAFPATIAGHWLLLEDGHHSDVRAGENAGAALRHDHVVRHLQPVAPWPAVGERRWTWQPPATAAAPGVRRRVAFVVEDAATGQPIQALALGC
jgi:hypothetical protein